MKNLIFILISIVFIGVFNTANAYASDVKSDSLVELENQIRDTLDYAIMTQYMSSLDSWDCKKKNGDSLIQCLMEYRDGVKSSQAAFQEYIVLIMSHPAYSPTHESLTKLPESFSFMMERSWTVWETSRFIKSQTKLINIIGSCILFSDCIEDTSSEAYKVVTEQYEATMQLRIELVNN
ncbi:hypothetical protein COB64_01455 [Candidatus Wolfebacteria bacterium]|nr:MAG: hypothetical protein COB64_01455 [Candidatus Wolfebacteria bacterium]